MRVTAPLLLLSSALLLTGCATPEPWVQPYERQHLADPIMLRDGFPLAAGHKLHVHEAREAARGADGSAGGGCGCN